MRKVAKIVLVIVVLVPVLYGVAYVMFPSVRPTPSSEDVFKRVTGLRQLPNSISNLETHNLFDPLLGDGHAIISFTVDPVDGEVLTEGIELRRFSRPRDKPLPIEISDPQRGRYEWEFRDGEIITNQKRTIFLWSGSI